MDPRQHAFLPGFGTGTYLASLGQILGDALKNDGHIELASLDLVKAYNLAVIPEVLEKLKKRRWKHAGIFAELFG